MFIKIQKMLTIVVGSCVFKILKASEIRLVFSKNIYLIKIASF